MIYRMRLISLHFIILAMLLSACSGSGSSGSGTPGITITVNDGGTHITEGGAAATYTVKLKSAPSDAVTLIPEPDAQLATLPSTLTFTAANWNQPQIVIVAAIDDRVAEGDHTGVINHSVSSGDANYNQFALDSLTITIADNDHEGVTITETAGITQVTEGGATDSYTLVLTSQPAADTVITVNGGSQLMLTPSTLTFTSTNWSAEQTVTVTAVDDTSVEGTHSANITHTAVSADAKYNGLNIRGLIADIIDDDTIATLNFVGSNAVIQEGAGIISIPIRMSLNAPVSISAPVNASVTASPSSTATSSVDFSLLSGAVNFPVGSTDNAIQELHIRITDDLINEAMEQIVLRITAASGVGATAGTARDYHINLHDNSWHNLIATDVVNMGGYSLSRLLSVNPSNGASQRQSGAGLAGFPVLGGMAFNSAAGTLYALTPDELIKLDVNTGIGSVIGPSSVSGPLAYNATSGVFYVSDGATLYTINTDSGATTTIGNFGAYTDVQGLAYNPNTNILYGSDTTANSLLTINTGTGAASAVGTFGVTALSGLAYDSVNNVLYASSTSQDRLYTVNTGTGAATQVGLLGFGNVALLSADNGGNILYGFDSATRQLITINKTSGAGTGLKVTGLGNNAGTQLKGLAYDSFRKIYYGVSLNPLGEQILVQVHAKTGNASSIAKLSGVTGTLYDLAYDPNSETLYGVNGGTLYRINTATAVATSIGATGGNPHGLAFDSSNNILYASDTNTDQLLTLNTGTGAKTVIGALGFGDVEGLAFNSAASILYGINTDPGGKDPRLLVINTGSGAGSPVGAVMHEGMTGALAYDDADGRLYAANQWGLLSLNTSTGLGSSVGQLGLDYVGDLAYNPNTAEFYAAANDNDDGKLVALNLANGSARVIGGLGRACCVDGMTFNPNSNTLYAVDTGTGELLSINTSSGAASSVGAIGFDLIRGALAFDPNTNTLYGIGATDIGCCGTGPYTYELITINPGTGAGTAVANISGYDGITALAFNPALNILYGFDEISGQLITLNTATAAVTVVGKSGHTAIQGMTWRY